MKQHLTDQEIIAHLFHVGEKEEIQATLGHLKKCGACRKRSDLLRAKFSQLDSLKDEIVAPEELIAKTLGRIGGGKQTAQISIVPPPEELPDPGFRNSTLINWPRFFWIGAMAAAAVLVVVALPHLSRRAKPAVLAMQRAGDEAMDRPDLPVEKREESDKLFARPRKAEAAPESKQRALAYGGSAESRQALTSDALAKSEKPAMPASPAAVAEPEPVQLAAATAATAPMPTGASAAPAAKRAAAATSKPLTLAAAPAPAMREKSDAVSVADTQTLPFFLPMTSGTWTLSQHVRVRAWARDDGVRLEFSNSSLLPLTVELRQSRSTNVLRRIPLESGATTNFFQKTK